MKKITLILLALLFVGLASAGISSFLPKEDKDIEIPKAEKELLSRAGLVSYEVPELQCDAEECNRISIVVPGVINTDKKFKPYWMNCTEYELDDPQECITEERVYYTNEQLQDQVNKWEKKVMDRVMVRQTITEEAEEEKTGKVPGGTRTLKESK